MLTIDECKAARDAGWPQDRNGLVYDHPDDADDGRDYGEMAVMYREYGFLFGPDAANSGFMTCPTDDAVAIPTEEELDDAIVGLVKGIPDADSYSVYWSKDDGLWEVDIETPSSASLWLSKDTYAIVESPNRHSAKLALWLKLKEAERG